jgi:serine/threonine protein kinase
MQFPVAGLTIPGPGGPGTIRLEKPLGGGAFGVVFLARDTESGAAYAVKFPQYAVFGGEPELRAFFNEVRAAQEIRHPNVVEVLHVEVGAPDVPPFLVMPHVAGGTLQSRLASVRTAGTSVDVAMVRRWSEALVDGMEAINAKMLHRDLKPDNILLDGDTPRISDFGLSKVIGAATRTQTFKGGQHMLYMAPEGWKLETNAVQIDMYALGIVLHEIAALRYPYQLPGETVGPEELKRMHLFQQPDPLKKHRPDLPLAFCQTVARLMEKRPQDRFAAWQDVRAALRKAFGSGPGPASPSPLVAALVETVGTIHDEETRKRLEAEQREAALREQAQMHAYQLTQLVNALSEAAQAFNQASVIGTIEVHRKSPARRCDFRLPFGESIRLKCFDVEPPLAFKRGEVRFAGLLQNPDGRGLNFLLCRSDPSDLYGTWVPCRARVNAIIDRSRGSYPSVEPFGFDVSDLHHVATADGGMHAYVLEFPEQSVGDLFLGAVRAAMERRPRS